MILMKKRFLLTAFFCCCSMIAVSAQSARCFDPEGFPEARAAELHRKLPVELAAQREWIAGFQTRFGEAFTPIQRKRISRRLEMAERLAAYIESAFKSADKDDIFFAERAILHLKNLCTYLSDEEKLARLFSEQKEIVLSIRDFGAQGDGVTDDSDAFQTALAKIAGMNGVPVKLFLPKGRYLLNKVHRVDNEESHLAFHNQKNITVEGETPDTTLIFGVNEKNGVRVFKSENIQLRNLVLLNRTVPFMEMEVESVDPEAQTITGRHIGPSLPADAPQVAGYGGPKLCFRRDGSLVTGDLWPVPDSLVTLPSGKIRMAVRRGPFHKVRPGMRIACPGRRGGSVVVFSCSRFCMLDRITIHNSWDLALVNHASHASTYSKVRIVPLPGLSFTTNGDGIHAANSGLYSGIGPTVIDCEFRAMGDDPINTYNRGWYVAAVQDHQLLTHGGEALAGDITYVYDSATGEIRAGLTATETTVRRNWGKYNVSATMVKEQIPSRIKSFDSLNSEPPAEDELREIYFGKSRREMPDVAFNPFRAGAWEVIADCVFADNRNCGPVIQCDNALVENVTIANIESFASKIGAFTTWREGPPPINVLMRNCKIRNSGGLRTEFYVLNPDNEIATGRHVRHITFENNELVNCHQPAFTIASSSGIEFINNRIVNPQKEAFKITNAGKLTFQGNTVNGKPYTPQIAGKTVWPVRASLQGKLSKEGAWRHVGAGLQNSGGDFEALYAAQYSALKKVKIQTAFRFLKPEGKAGLRLVEHVGVPDNGYYFLLDGATGLFTVSVWRREGTVWKPEQVVFRRQLETAAVNSLEVLSEFTWVVVKVNGKEIWRGGAPLPTLFRSGFVAFDAPVSVEKLEIAGGGHQGGILAFGDSITHHCRWQDTVGKLAGLEIGNGGMACDDTINARKRLESDVIALQPDLVLLLLGTNNSSATQAMTDLKYIIRRLRSARINVIVCTILPRPQPERAVKLNRLLRQYCRQEQILLHDWYEVMNDGNGNMKKEYGGDVHPNTRGIEVMARSFIENPVVKKFILQSTERKDK